jgi:hypothetical protein
VQESSRRSTATCSSISHLVSLRPLVPDRPFSVFRDIDKVEAITDEISERMNVNREISEAISNPLFGNAVDEDELAQELEELEQEQLDEKLAGAAPVPVTSPGPSLREPGRSLDTPYPRSGPKLTPNMGVTQHEPRRANHVRKRKRTRISGSSRLPWLCRSFTSLVLHTLPPPFFGLVSALSLLYVKSLSISSNVVLEARTNRATAREAHQVVSRTKVSLVVFESVVIVLKVLPVTVLLRVKLLHRNSKSGQSHLVNTHPTRVIMRPTCLLVQTPAVNGCLMCCGDST